MIIIYGQVFYNNVGIICNFLDINQLDSNLKCGIPFNVQNIALRSGNDNIILLNTSLLTVPRVCLNL